MKQRLIISLFFLFLFSQSAQAATPVGYWAFEESDGTTVQDGGFEGITERRINPDEWHYLA